MSLSIIIPCKNEEQTIIKTITKINKIIKRRIKEYEYILINDFSNDNTYEEIKKLSKSKKISKLKIIKSKGWVVQLT